MSLESRQTTSTTTFNSQSPSLLPWRVEQHSKKFGQKARFIPVIVATAEEQHRIVEAIDSYLTRLDDAVASLERVQAKLKAYRASVLKAAVEGRLVPTEAALARAEKRAYEPAEALLARILKERRRRWEEAELAKLKAAGRTPRDDKWKGKYEEPVALDTSTASRASRGLVLGDRSARSLTVACADGHEPGQSLRP